MKKLALILSFLTSLVSLSAQQTERQYLSGTDSEHTVPWEFYCTAGRNSGSWTTIAVPAHWEQEGFGRYDYGRDYRTYGKDFQFADEKGLYRHTFTVPAGWKDKRIVLIFEGSMTDTEVKVNGQLAGPIHQGAFYRFSFDITDKVKLQGPNRLEVTVSKMSANHSVNRAERYADYWIFGGIFRPVYLEALPSQHIRHTAITALADGTFRLRAQLQGLQTATLVKAEIRDQAGQLMETIQTRVKAGDTTASLETKLRGIKTWTSETPHLYSASLTLNEGNKILHQTTERFGFRTIEIREGDGVYINGTKVKFKGINRHCFWPETGRALSPRMDLLDVQLLKEMNMNAVRCSHYPPDKTFLEYCDSLGLYVIDELAGWQEAYDTEAGEKLVREMVLRDVNHPSIIFWSNGNEGGTNKDLDDDYGLYDPSGRPVIHAHHRPGNDYNGIETNHYETYSSTQQILQGDLIYMPTEFLHGQDDGGMAAALYDYWELMWASPKSAGGFLWAFIDEGIVRRDMNDLIDVNRLNAPDGVLGPHREKEGSFNAIREIWSPIVIPAEKIDPATGIVEVENRYHFTNLNQCRFTWELVMFHSPADWRQGYEIVATGELPGPAIAPGGKGPLTIPLPGGKRAADAVVLTAYGPDGKEVLSWNWKLKSNAELISPLIDKRGEEVKAEATDSVVTLRAGGISFSISKLDGTIGNLRNSKGLDLEFGGGPVLTEGQGTFRSLKHYRQDDTYVVESSYEGNLQRATWRMYGSGWVSLTYTYQLDGPCRYPGISFVYPESNILGARWLGDGPYRVWKNRTQGVTFNVWENLYNDSQAGSSPWIFPEFKGYFSDLCWIRINTSEGAFLVATEEEDLYVRLFDFTGIQGPEKYYPSLPPGNLSFLDAIPPIGTKLATGIDGAPFDLGPSGLLQDCGGPVTKTLYFYFGLWGRE